MTDNTWTLDLNVGDMVVYERLDKYSCKSTVTKVTSRTIHIDRESLIFSRSLCMEWGYYYSDMKVIKPLNRRFWDKYRQLTNGGK